MDWSKALQRPHGLPRGKELDHCVQRAKQGDKLAAYRVHMLLATDLRRDTLDTRERDLLASMHEAIAKGIDPVAAMLLTKPQSRPPKAQMHAFIADWIAREIEAHAVIKARGGKHCNNGCAKLTKRAAYDHAGELFGFGWSRAKAIHRARGEKA